MLSIINFIKVVVMKKIRFTLIVLFLFSAVFISCEKDRSHSDESEEIPGMGDSDEELEVDEPLYFPIGLSLVGDITGVEVNSEPLENPIGSGGQWVILDVLIQNVSDKDANFFLPGGSVVECQIEGYQHAICIQRVDVLVEKESSKPFKLLVFCINEGRSGSSPDITYEILGISNSDKIMSLVDALEDKKIDIRDYLPNNKAEFEEICIKIQDVVWAITNGSGLSDEDWSFVNSLPNVVVE